MNCIGTYDGTIFYNPANKFCIISVKTADQSVPAEARSNRRYKDHLIRFTAVGYEIPRTDAVELELDGEWAKGKYGVQLQVEQWREIVPRTKNGVEGYLASGLIKGIGPKTAADIVERFGVDTLDILEHQPERLLEIRGITENKLEDIKASYAENRMLQGIMTLLAPFKITPKTALKIYQYFGPTSVEILEKSPFELCQISGFGFRRVDAIVQKSGGDLHDPMRIKGAVFCALDEGKSKRGHLYISSEELEKSALKLLNEKIPVPELRLHQQEVRDMMQEMILNGAIVSVKDNIYLPRVFAQEDETARWIAQRLVTQMPVEHIAPVLEQVKVEMGLRLSAQQEAAVYAAFRHKIYMNSEKTEYEVMSEGNPLNEALRQEVLAVDGVTDVIENRQAVHVRFENEESSSGGMCDLLSDRNRDQIEATLVSGTLPQDSHSIALDMEYAEDMIGVEAGSVIKLSIGDQEIPVTVSGLFLNDGLQNGHGPLALDNTCMVATKELFQEAMPMIDCFDYSWSIVSDPQKAEQIENSLSAIISSDPDLALDTIGIHKDYEEMENRVVFGGFQALSWLVFLFGVVNLINTTLSNQMSRKRENSVFRAIGLTRKQLCQMTIYEGICYAFSAALATLAVGLPIAMIAARKFSEMTFHGAIMPYSFPFLQMGLFVLVLFGLEVILSFWTMRRQKNQSLVEEMRAME